MKNLLMESRVNLENSLSIGVSVTVFEDLISHVSKEKGIYEILETLMHLDSGYIIDISGLITDEKHNKEHLEKYNVSLEAKAVIEKLNEYDVVLLPSYKQGYLRIIIETYLLGIPVISKTLKNIEEIVGLHETGILVKPGNIDELIQLIKYYTNENYVEMSQNTYNKFDDFKSDIQTKLFLEQQTNA